MGKKRTLCNRVLVFMISTNSIRILAASAGLAISSEAYAADTLPGLENAILVALFWAGVSLLLVGFVVYAAIAVIIPTSSTPHADVTGSAQAVDQIAEPLGDAAGQPTRSVSAMRGVIEILAVVMLIVVTIFLTSLVFRTFSIFAAFFAFIVGLLLVRFARGIRLTGSRGRRALRYNRPAWKNGSSSPPLARSPS